MSVTGRSRAVVVAAGLAGLALVGALLIGSPKGGGPALAAPGNHATVSVADSANGPVAMGNGVFMGAALKHDASKPLRELKQYPAHPIEVNGHEGDREADAGRPAPLAADTVVQSTLASPAMPATSLSFDGIGFPGVACNCAPPDTNGEVGATQYVQIVNEGYQVWNKATGASVYGPVGITTIWSGFGGVCETAGDGDPVVLYDQLANRWLVSQFAGSSVPTDECIAVSQTSDATGGWYRYDFHLGSNFFDYPHLSVWPDGYYMSMNVFNSAGTMFLGAQPFVFDRAKMLAGQAATFQTTGNLGSTSDPILPADLDGSTLPPSGAPATFIRYPRLGTYQTYHYATNWVTPASSTFTTFASPAAAPFTAACGACVPQPGTTSTLDTLGDRLMFRLAYRNFGDHESVVGNYTVQSGGVTAVRWFEIRNVTSGPETVFQESTYQPDSTYRWMGSAAMDHNGDIAVGFSASSSSVVPSLRYAGRLVGDPLGSLAQGEAVLFGGAGSQTGTSSRWGDYSDMTVDPVDDCTFWFTSEYYPSGTSSFNWRTRIGSFKFSSCTTTPPVFTSIGVTPSSASVPVTTTQQFTATAYDQFNQPLSPQPVFTWSVSGGGTISSSGLFTAGATTGGPFTVTAASGGLSGTASVTVTPPSPDFSLHASPTAASVRRGGTATYTITISDLNGFSGPVTFSLSGQPSGSTVTFSPNPTTTSATLTVKTSSSAPRRSYTLTITGVSGGLTHSITVTLTVTK